MSGIRTRLSDLSLGGSVEVVNRTGKTLVVQLGQLGPLYWDTLAPGGSRVFEHVGETWFTVSADDKVRTLPSEEKRSEALAVVITLGLFFFFGLLAAGTPYAITTRRQFFKDGVPSFGSGSVVSITENEDNVLEFHVSGHQDQARGQGYRGEDSLEGGYVIPESVLRAGHIYYEKHIDADVVLKLAQLGIVNGPALVGLLREGDQSLATKLGVRADDVPSLRHVLERCVRELGV